MRFLFWFLMLAVAAVVVALAVKLNAGYALLVAPPYRIELSLNLLLLIVVGGFSRFISSIRLVVRTLRLPQQVRAWRRQQKIERARTKQDSAVVALLEGRYGKARQHAEEALAIPGSSRAERAHRGSRGDRCPRFRRGREAPRGARRADAEPRRAAADARRGNRARARASRRKRCGLLQELRKEAGMHTAALRLELRTLQAARRWAEIPAAARAAGQAQGIRCRRRPSMCASARTASN